MTARVERTAIKRSEVIQRPRRQTAEGRPAPFSLRCGAVLIDYILLVGIVAFSTIIARMMGGGARSAGNSAETFGIVVAVVVALLNLGLFAGLTGLTIGKWATGLRIERRDGGAPGIGFALLRHFVGYPLSFLTLGLGFLLAALSERGRALHDLIARTVVVRDSSAF
jgi:uncharacterized RDD family membrane protein YckC